MERKFYTDDFEQLLKDNADDFRMYPSKRVWHSIYNDLHPGRKWPSIAGSIILISALFIAGYWNSATTTKDVSTTISKPSVPDVTASSSLAGKDFPLNTSAGSANISYLPALIIPLNNNPKVTTAITNTGTPYAGGSYNPGYKSPQILAFNNIIDGSSTIALNKSAAPAGSNISVIPQQNNGLAQQNNVEVSVLQQSPNTGVESKALIITQGIDEDMTSVTFEEAEKNETAPAESALPKKETLTENKTQEKSLSSIENAVKTTLSANDKAWIENYALHHKTARKKWKERSTITLYATPNIGYRKLSNDSKYNVAPTTAPLGAVQPGVDADKAVNQKPGLGLEAGMNINYAVAKNLRLKVGVQGNYTNYSAKADETNHPVLTTIMMVDPNSGFPYMQASSTTLSNSSAFKPVNIHNKTYQISIPLGLAYKLTGNDKIEWFAGGTIQPTLVLGGKAYLISADRKNYVADKSHMRKWNVNAGFESYINYKFDGFTLQAGPQFRYQILSTNFTKYTVQENLYNIGVKVGVVKNF